jgi:hypothetical protein
MKEVQKVLIDRLIEMSKKTFEDTEEYKNAEKAARDLQEQTGVHWIAWLDLCTAVFGSLGFDKKAKNETVYDLLKVLGFEVVDKAPLIVIPNVDDEVLSFENLKNKETSLNIKQLKEAVEKSLRENKGKNFWEKLKNENS